MKFLNLKTSFLCLALCGVMVKTAAARHFRDQKTAQKVVRRTRELRAEDPCARQTCTILLRQAGKREGAMASGLLIDTRHVLTAGHAACEYSEVRVAPPGERCYVMQDTANALKTSPLWQ
jgi:hypothetical protein